MDIITRNIKDHPNPIGHINIGTHSKIHKTITSSLNTRQRTRTDQLTLPNNTMSLDKYTTTIECVHNYNSRTTFVVVVCTREITTNSVGRQQRMLLATEPKIIPLRDLATEWKFSGTEWRPSPRDREWGDLTATHTCIHTYIQTRTHTSRCIFGAYTRYESFYLRTTNTKRCPDMRLNWWDFYENFVKIFHTLRKHNVLRASQVLKWDSKWRHEMSLIRFFTRD